MNFELTPKKILAALIFYIVIDIILASSNICAKYPGLGDFICLPYLIQDPMYPWNNPFGLIMAGVLYVIWSLIQKKK